MPVSMGPTRLQPIGVNGTVDDRGVWFRGTRLAPRRVLELLTSANPHTPQGRADLQGLALVAQDAARNGARGAGEVAQLARNLLAAAPPPPDREVPRVPWHGVALAAVERRPLDAVDAQWLSTLPDQPDRYSDAQVIELARLAASVDTRSAGGRDFRMVDERWRPVREHHERQVRRAQVAADLAEAKSVNAGKVGQLRSGAVVEWYAEHADDPALAGLPPGHRRLVAVDQAHEQIAAANRQADNRAADLNAELAALDDG